MTALDNRTLDAPTVLEALSEAEALEWLHANRCTDGLPVVIPTTERVDRLVLASGLDGALSLGTMGPGGGDATVEKVATNAVMAGCVPDHMPIVIAAVQAILKPEFDLGEMQGTTHNTAPLIIVSGPARHSAQIATGFGALGPGHRANASIGRALRLAMINIGMARTGESDMALLGHAGKFTYCLGETEEVSPWEPLHTDWGFTPEQSAVTVVGAEAPHSVIFVSDADDPNSPDRLLKTIAKVMANLGSNNAHFRCGAQTVILNPDHATVLADAGLSRADIKQRLVELAVNPAEVIMEINPSYAGREGSENRTIAAVRSPEDIVLFVAGGTGLYTTVMPSWAAGPHANAIVSAEVFIDQTCEIPAR